MQQAIVGYHQDEERHWVAELRCGHFQHVRHDPPWINRPWVTSAAGRDSKLGIALECSKCDRGDAKDSRPDTLSDANPLRPRRNGDS